MKMNNGQFEEDKTGKHDQLYVLNETGMQPTPHPLQKRDGGYGS
jgi:hypothetical protein